MSTDQLVNAVLRKVPDADPGYILELLVECEGDVSKVFKLLGLAGSGTKVQSTFKVSKLPPPTVKSSKQKSGVVFLHTPEQVRQAKINCTLHLNVLDGALANSLLGQLLMDSDDWDSGKFHLFDREVQSPHTSASYADDKALLKSQKSTYQGRMVGKIRPFTPEMAQARDSIERIVNEEISKAADLSPSKTAKVARWQSHFAICNHYRNKDETVGYHSDQLTHLGPNPTIAGLSLGSSREFRFKSRHEKHAQIFSVQLPHNSLVIMHAGNQELFKHSIVPVRAVDANAISGSSRISITYRHYHEDYTYDKIPRCRCNQPMILRTTIGIPYKYIWQCGKAYQGGQGCRQVIEKKV